MIQKIIYFSLISMFLISCSNSSNSNSEIVTTTIVGSRENPDPVLNKVLELQKTGDVKNVEIMESYPVQIKLTASKIIISDLNDIPRK